MVKSRTVKRKPSTDIWHVGIAPQPIHTFLEHGAPRAEDIIWLPSPGKFRFIADPFGIWHDGTCTVFVEALDYRIKRGEIHYYQYDKNFQLMGQGVALKSDVHLSYPTILREGATIYMLPEAHKSGTLTLYRAERFPDQWQPVATLLELPAIDASVIYHQDRWWMFYALPGPNGRALRELHIAHAETLMGPWIQHPLNPVRAMLNSSRPGGTPFVHEGALYLPMQDCVEDYGAALNLLRIDTLTPDHFVANMHTHLAPLDFSTDYPDGLHTLAACGDITLFDVKRIDYSKKRRLINLQRRLNRLRGQH